MMKKLLIAILIFGMMSCSTGQKKETIEHKEEPKQEPQKIERAVLIDEKEAQRTEWQNPELIISLLGELDGMTIADVGAGSGYFSFKISPKAEKVIALEIDPSALEYINQQKKIVGEWAQNIEARLTPPDVPNLSENEVDKVLIVNTYSFLPNRISYLSRLLDGMKPNADLLIVDFKMGEIPVGPADELKLAPKEVKRELRKAGFKQIIIETEQLSYQYFITAKKK